MDKCKRCSKEIPKEESLTSWGKISRCCKSCREDRNRWAKDYYVKWNKVVKKDNKEYYHKNRDRFKFQRRNNALKRKYNIDIKTYEQMFAQQHGNCALCGLPMIESHKKGWSGKQQACVDHEHKTGKVRGILHRGCNLALSMIEDETFTKLASQYLASQRCKE